MKQRDTESFRRTRLILFLVSLAAVLLTAAGAYLVFGYEKEEPPEEPASFCFRLGVWEDRLAVFTGGELKPTEILDIPLEGLPETDRVLLTDGIPLRDREELRRAIEDYS